EHFGGATRHLVGRTRRGRAQCHGEAFQEQLAVGSRIEADALLLVPAPVVVFGSPLLSVASAHTPKSSEGVRHATSGAPTCAASWSVDELVLHIEGAICA